MPLPPSPGLYADLPLGFSARLCPCRCACAAAAATAAAVAPALPAKSLTPLPLPPPAPPSPTRPQATEGLQRRRYWLLEEKEIVLVHYLAASPERPRRRRGPQAGAKRARAETEVRALPLLSSFRIKIFFAWCSCSC